MHTENQLIPAQETTISLFEDIVYFRFDMKPVTGLVFENFENGERKIMIGYKDGKLNGPCKEWYENGFLKYYYNYKEGIRNGEFKRWNEEGKLFSIETFIDGKLEGYRYLNFTESCGSNDEFSQFDRKMLDEIFIQYSDEIFEEGYHGGSLTSQKRYVLNPDYKSNNLEEGYTSIEVSRQVYGIIDVDIEYDGEKEIYNEIYGFSEEYTCYSVRPIEFLNFQNGEPHGRQTYLALVNPYSEYNYNFYLFKEENYLFGRKHGKQLLNYCNGKNKAEENYEDGVKEGKQYKWNDEGLLEAEENYENGEKHGEQKYWN
jgi:antitoxin component YwqK of YwqJK toxin-antitoxin module